MKISSLSCLLPFFIVLPPKFQTIRSVLKINILAIFFYSGNLPNRKFISVNIFVVAYLISGHSGNVQQTFLLDANYHVVSKHRIASGVLYKHARDQLRTLICMTIWHQQKHVYSIRLNSNKRVLTSQHINLDRVSQTNDRVTSFFVNPKDQDFIVYTIKNNLYIIYTYIYNDDGNYIS